MAGKGSKTTSGISTNKILYGWDGVYSSDAYVVTGVSGQSVIYGSPYWFEKLLGGGNETLYVGGFFSTAGYSAGSGSARIDVKSYQADYIDGGTGSNWISFQSFTNLATGPVGYETRAGSNLPPTAGNDYRDFGRDPVETATVRNSLISGTGLAQDVTGTPGVVINLSNKTLGEALAPLIRVTKNGATQSYGLVGGLSDYLSGRLLGGGAIDALDGGSSNLYDPVHGLGARQYAFYTRDGSGKFAIGQVVNVQNVQGSNDASNVIFGGPSNGILQGGKFDDIIVGGTGNNQLYGMGGADLLVSTVGNDTLYAAQFGNLGTTTPTAAKVTDRTIIKGTTMVAGTGIVTMVGSDVGDDVFLAGKANATVYGSGLGSANANDYDTLSFTQIGRTYYEGAQYRGLTVTITYADTARENGTATVTYITTAGSIATLLNVRFFDIENIVTGTLNVVFKDPNGTFYPSTYNPGFTGGDPANLNNTTGLLDPGPSTSTVTGNNPAGGNVLQGGGGGNTNFDGGPGGNNTLNFASSGDTLYYDCEDQSGDSGSVRNFSLVLDLGTGRYTYQQSVNGQPTVYGGTVTNIQNIIGTVDCSDIIVGNSQSITLTGGGGEHNILYAGGSTSGGQGTTLNASRSATATNGGDGYNWAVFQRPTDLINGGGGANNGAGRTGEAYSSGVTANLTGAAPSGVGTRTAGVGQSYTFTSGSTQYTGQMNGFANVLGTAGIDTLIGNSNDNILVGAGGNDTITGNSGADILYGGSGLNTLTGDSADNETYVIGYDYNPVAAGAYSEGGAYGPKVPDASVSGNSDGTITKTIPGGTTTVKVISVSASALDHISGWNKGVNAGDMLYVSSSGHVVVDGFDTDHSGVTLDFRMAQNLGQIDVTVGNGNNTIYGSDSTWDTGVGGDDVIVVGSGNNTIYLGGGDDRVYTGGGYNSIYLGTGGVDKVYIKSLTTRDDIKGFQPGIDKIYLDTSMLNSWGISNQTKEPTNTATHRILAPQDYKSGVFIGAPLFDVVYRAYVNNVDVSNGATNNNQHLMAKNAGIAAEVVLQIAMFGIAYSLYAIPFVGPILAAVFTGLGLGIIADQATAQAHRNPAYDTVGDTLPLGRPASNPIWGYVNVMHTNNSTGSAFASDPSWTSTPFMSFYQYSTAGGFTPSLEVVNGFSEIGPLGYPVWNDQNLVTTFKNAQNLGADGIHTVALLHSNNQTFIYLINSEDNLIQSNEARLIARVDGYITADDIELFDATTDAYAGGAAPAPDFPPELDTITYAASHDGKSVTAARANGLTGASTNDDTVVLTIALKTALVATDVVTITNGVSTQTFTNQTGTSLTVTLTNLVNGNNNYTVSIASADGFVSEALLNVVVDSLAPNNDTKDSNNVYINAVGVTTSALGIGVSANEKASAALYSGSTLIQLDTNPTTIDGTTKFVPLNASYSATFVPVAQGSVTWLDSVHFVDAVGNTSTVTFGTQPDGTTQLPFIALGTTGNDSINVATDTHIADAAKNNAAVYGFGGSDSITASSSTATFTTFIGGKDVANTVTANSNGGNLVIDLTNSNSYADLVKLADGAAALHSDSSASVIVTGFDSSDKLVFTGDPASGTGATSLYTGAPVTVGSITYSVSNGIIVATGAGAASATLATLLSDIKGLLSDGQTVAFSYRYSTTDPAGASVNHNDLIVVHDNNTTGYEVIQLPDIGSTANSLLVTSGAITIA